MYLNLSLLLAIPATYSVTASPDLALLGVNREITFTCVEFPLNQIHNVEESIGWQFQSSEGGALQDIVMGDRFVVTEMSLTIRQLQVADSGTYFCVASNPLVTPILTAIGLRVEGVYVTV